MSTIDEIKSRIDIVDLVSETVKLRRSGKNYTGFCPFHPNSRTPAFVVFPESGTWRCFGQCNEGGDIFKYVMKKEGWDFPEALRHLAERAGVQLQPQYQEQAVAGEEFQRLHSLLEESVTFYRYQLLHTAAGQAALEYLHHRGLRDEIIETFGLGYAPQSGTKVYLSGKSYTAQEMLDAGMLSERDNGELFDRFRNRITFPIRDAQGRMVGFGARILDPNDMPKFLNSPQTALFNKGHLLFGLDQARKAIRTQEQAVIVEGYLDVIALHQGGFANTVSPMGTALTETQLHLLKRFTRRFVLALDADAAGEKATLRGLELARQSLDRGDELAFDARGLLRHEARLQADVRVTTLPPGMDPDEVVNRDPAEWAHIIESAKPVVMHVMEALTAGQNMDDPKIKGQIADQVLPLIEDVPNAVEREDYRQRLARLLRVDERALIGAQPAPARMRRSRSQERPSTAPISKPPLEGSQVTEAFVIKMLLANPEILYQLDRILQKVGLSRLAVQDFNHTDYQMFIALVQESLEQDDVDPHQYILDRFPEALDEARQELLEPAPNNDTGGDARLEALYQAILRLRAKHLTESLDQLRFLQEEAQKDGDLLATPYQEMALQQIRTRERLDKAMNKPLIKD